MKSPRLWPACSRLRPAPQTHDGGRFFDGDLSDCCRDEDHLKTKIISRGEALAQGLKRYFTGKPCHAGHVAERRSKDGRCVECSRDRYLADPEKVKGATRCWRETNPEKAKVASNRWRETYPEKFRAYRREYMREYMRQRRAVEEAAQYVAE